MVDPDAGSTSQHGSDDDEHRCDAVHNPAQWRDDSGVTRRPRYLSDLVAVLTELDLPSPVLAGHSLGADTAVHYASAHPDAVAELALIDGANPVPEPFRTEAELPESRAARHPRPGDRGDHWMQTCRLGMFHAMQTCRPCQSVTRCGPRRMVRC
ncbi:alpha/beta hydrolase [Nocardia sp. NBC_01499]|uniref:alpha/beta fold hydrolase n=1 Tax=Nocardia sp. NBC_01499 TaxID=2903597 RepID=UPI0038646966